MKKSILPLLLALVIMLGMIPAGFAQDTEEGAEQHSYEAPVFTGIETGRAYCNLPAFTLSGAESVFAYEILSGRGLELARNEETGEYTLADQGNGAFPQVIRITASAPKESEESEAASSEVTVVVFGKHDYTVQWSWSDDLTEASAELTCSVCGERVGNIPATVASNPDENLNKVTYTAYFDYGGKTYSETRIVITNTSEPEVTPSPVPTETPAPTPVPEEKKDTTAPLIVGISNGATYCTATQFSVYDEMSGVSSVTLNGKEIKPDSNGRHTASVSGTIVATDGAGNSEKVSVYVAGKHTYSGNAMGSLIWSWGSDFKSATLYFTCVRCRETGAAAATVTSARSGDSIIYTATAKDGNGQTYTDQRKVKIEKETVTVQVPAATARPTPTPRPTATPAPTQAPSPTASIAPIQTVSPEGENNIAESTQESGEPSASADKTESVRTGRNRWTGVALIIAAIILIGLIITVLIKRLRDSEKV
ncbi:MAG: hypothetical protein IJJ67_08135 [Oscillospiraceae bacterium]|nr:hypothetical protein [Oscillospiraceae bacterium]